MKHNNATKQLGALMISCALWLSGSNIATGAISVPDAKSQVTSLKSTALVNSSEIKADCLIKSQPSSKIREQMAQIYLGHIPDPLGELILDKAEIQRKLGSLATNIIIPDQVVVKRAGAILRGSEISERINAACHGQTSENLTIDLSRIPANIVLPGNLQSWEISTNSENTLGMKLFVLTAQTDGGPFRQLLQVRVSRVVEAAELVRLAKPGELVNSTMIRKKNVEVKSDQSNVPITYEAAVGKCIGRYKSPGTVLRSSDLSTGASNICADSTSKSSAVAKSFARTSKRDNWLIKPGESVDYHFNSGTLSLKVPAKAVQGGGEGDEITLINLQNQRRIRGIIRDKGRVDYAQN